MRKESKITKFSLEKFEVVKLKNLKEIRGGDDTNDTNDSLVGSSRQCAASRNHQPPCNDAGNGLPVNIKFKND